MPEHLLGFDVREDWLAGDAIWDETRRRKFLLRPYAPKPLSVDPTVWPSVFRAGDGEGMIGDLLRPRGVFVVPVPAWIGPSGVLWSDLAAMRRHLAAGWQQPRPTATVAVSWVTGPGDDPAAGPDLVATTPAERSDEWDLLGYDVADRWLLSGLANCGYDDSEIDRLRDRWAPLLNARHLFADATVAFAFRELTNARVTEHAPFFVYALYRL